MKGGAPRRSWVEIERLAEYYKPQIRTETHWESEFFLDDEIDWMRAPSSPIDPRETICLA